VDMAVHPITSVAFALPVHVAVTSAYSPSSE
jgi:hypothetical protein